VFTHYRDDRHQDHRLVSDLTWQTFRRHLILEYEVPKYDGDLGSPNAFVRLEQKICRAKVDVACRCFESQCDKHWFTKDNGVGRFRVSCFYQRNQVGMVLRRIETKIPTIEELSLPPIIKTLAMTKRGIILFVGATGTGKSTSLAAMIGYRNQNSTGHIITIEDPIEFVHKHEGCIITQREVGIDTDSWDAALRNTLRQAPDVIMIGEVRTREGMDHAIAFAETGHLVLCTLHANNANQAMDRIINFFPEDRRGQLLMDLSLNLKGVVAQQLIPSPDGKTRKVAMEILLGTPLVQDYIREGEVHKLKEVMKESINLGMKTFDQALFELYQAGEISYEDALRYADSANEVRLRIKLAQGGDARTLSQGLDGVEVAEAK
jgi:twitching motility protein PilU